MPKKKISALEIRLGLMTILIPIHTFERVLVLVSSICFLAHVSKNLQPILILSNAASSTRLLTATCNAYFSRMHRLPLAFPHHTDGDSSDELCLLSRPEGIPFPFVIRRSQQQRQRQRHGAIVDASLLQGRLRRWSRSSTLGVGRGERGDALGKRKRCPELRVRTRVLHMIPAYVPSGHLEEQFAGASGG